MGGRHVAVVAGTRPEAIKLAPVVAALRASGLIVTVIGSGQHRTLFSRAAETSGLRVDIQLGLMQPGDTPARLLARAVPAIRDALRGLRPDLVIVQGDTASAYAGAAAAHALGIRLAHVEAGLRAPDIADPFPEELFRRAIARLADLHLAPTPRAAQNLEGEGVHSERIAVTGNSGIDALVQAHARVREQGLRSGARELMQWVNGNPLALVTVHRSQNSGARLESICAALRTIGEDDMAVVFPMHPEPQRAATIRSALDGARNVRHCAALDHDGTVALLARAAVVLTDSGGLCEEAAAMGIPTVILRSSTERIEAVDAGRATLAGADPAKIVAQVRAARSKGKLPPSHLFGDGAAGPRIAGAVAKFLKQNG